MEEKNTTSSIDILALLKESKGEFVSGEELSRHLGITRAAVWKRINSLKKEGYQIESSTKKGYRYNQNEEPYGRTAILNGLTTHYVGRELKFYSSVESTNLVLKKLAQNGAKEGAVVIADHQTKGRGRLGRDWLSSPQAGIWMSVLFRPKLHPMKVQSLTLAASVAVCRALSCLNFPQVGIKWPNDIMMDNKKVCGILTELSAEMERIAWVIVGIGVNVNQLETDFPDNLKDTATSLRLNTKDLNILNRNTIAASIINAIESVYESFVSEGSEKIVEEWKKWNKTLGKRVRLIKENEGKYARALDITPEGRLVVEYEDGALDEIFSGEISLREV